jgi:hypothetical protein
MFGVIRHIEGGTHDSSGGGDDSLQLSQR